MQHHALSLNVSKYNPGGRFIPPDAIKDSATTDSLVSAIGHIPVTAQGSINSGVGFNATSGVFFPGTLAANPYFRKTLFGAVVGEPVNYVD